MKTIKPTRSSSSISIFSFSGSHDNWAVVRSHTGICKATDQASKEILKAAVLWTMGVWGVLADIATVAQLSGLHAVMLIGLAARLLRIPQCKRECTKLEECARKLHALLQWPTTGQEIVMQHPAMAGLVVAALVEAAGLVDSYSRSTLWCRVRTGRSKETRFRDTQDRVSCLCALVLCVHANLLTQPAVHPPSGTNTTSDIRSMLNQRYNSISQGGADNQSDNTEPGGSETV